MNFGGRRLDFLAFGQHLGPEDAAFFRCFDQVGERHLFVELETFGQGDRDVERDRLARAQPSAAATSMTCLFGKLGGRGARCGGVRPSSASVLTAAS